MLIQARSCLLLGLGVLLALRRRAPVPDTVLRRLLRLIFALFAFARLAQIADFAHG